MRIILSPSKTMNEKVLENFKEVPSFLDKTKEILGELRTLSDEALQGIWKCNEELFALNKERINEMDLKKDLTPAIFTYEGLQFQNIQLDTLDDEELAYLEEHLRILSGFYGLVKPFNGIRPYRLEMQARLSVEESKNLYDFWGDTLADALYQESETLLNLSSKEYEKAVLKHYKGRCVSVSIGELKDGSFKSKGTLAKQVRGDMIHFLAKHRAKTPEALIDYDGFGVRYSKELSTEKEMVFIKG